MKHMSATTPSKTYSEFFASLTAAEQAIVSRLRSIVLDTFPDFTEKISYGVPYYFHNTRVCFIWPASVRPGPPSGVQFGLCRGYLLSNDRGLLAMNGRKQVATVTFHSVEEIDEQALRELIDEAVLIDEQCARR